MKNWLLFDMNLLCYRAKHSTGKLEFEGQGTGVAFGVVRALEDISQLFPSDVLILAFDSGHSIRKTLLPTYKANRHENLSLQDIEENRIFYDQINRLQKILLPMFGYRNIVQIQGYEADDVIAQFARDKPDTDSAVIVSSDGDLLQCLSQTVCCFNPITKKTTTKQDFETKWGIGPERWARVKALAGCKSDNVAGIKGVGDMTAVKFLTGKINPSKDPENKPGKLEKIRQNLETAKNNLLLVQLPYPGLILPEIQPDEITDDSKQAVMIELGIRSARRTERAKAAGKRKQQMMSGGFEIGDLE